MWCNQIFSLLALSQEATEEQPAIYVVANSIVADNYEIANRIARMQYGDTAIAVETTLYPVTIGHTYVDGNFYNDEGVVIERNKTEEERITLIERQLANFEGESVWDELAVAIEEGVNEV